MSFTVDKIGYYKRRDGKKARVVCVDANSDFSVLSIEEFEPCHEVIVRHHLNDGRCALTTATKHDLIAPWTDPEIGSLEWVRTLPPETKVWRKTLAPSQFALAKDLYAQGSPDGWFIVGTAEWANALPEGTKVRWESWPKGTFVTKTSTGWSKESNFYNAPGESGGTIPKWELYREPTLRPWKPEEVPVGAQIRKKGYLSRWLILGCNNSQVFYGNNVFDTFENVANGGEHSIDGGKTWLPCGVEDAR